MDWDDEWRSAVDSLTEWDRAEFESDFDGGDDYEVEDEDADE